MSTLTDVFVRGLRLLLEMADP